jgi:hypothetical protein
MTSPVFVSVKALAEEAGLDRSSARKALKRAGFQLHHRRLADSANQKAACLTEDDAELFLAMRREAGHQPGVKRSVENPSAQDAGSFYVIALAPGCNSDLKLGFSESAERRLSEHRTAAPRAVLLGSWPCRRGWEQTAIECITAEGCTYLGGECFNFSDPAGAVTKAEAFFALMPSPGYRPALDEASPLNT